MGNERLRRRNRPPGQESLQLKCVDDGFAQVVIVHDDVRVLGMPGDLLDPIHPWLQFLGRVKVIVAIVHSGGGTNGN